MYQVSQISRPLTALTVRFLKMSDSAMSMVAGRAGIPKSTTLPPCRTIPNASSIARSAPDISKTTPTPMPSFCSANHAGTSSDLVDVHDGVGAELPRQLHAERNVVGREEPSRAERLARSRS